MARDIDWVAVRVAYVTGQDSYKTLAEKLNVPVWTVSRKMKSEGWYQERRNYRESQAKAKTENVAKEELRKRERIFEVADKLLDLIERGLADGTIPGNGKGFRDVTGALKDIKDIKELRNPLEEQEQIARIEKLRADAKRANEIVGADIKVTLAPELEEYTQ